MRKNERDTYLYVIDAGKGAASAVPPRAKMTLDTHLLSHLISNTKTRDSEGMLVPVGKH
jgi:hypothetical protein